MSLAVKASLYIERDDMSARPHITSSFKEGGTTVEIRVFAAKGTNVQELLNVLFDEYVHVVGQIQDKWGSKETMT